MSEECAACSGDECEYEDMCQECKEEVDGLLDDIYWIATGEL